MRGSSTYEVDASEPANDAVADDLHLYAGAMQRHPLLDRAGERALAIEIEARSRALWTLLLSAALPLVRQVAAERLPAAAPTFRRVARATPQTRDAVIRRASARLHALDTDHLLADEVVERLAGGCAAVDAAARAVTDARGRFVQANVGLALHLAGRYHSRTLSFTDLAQEGMLGLIKAVDRFEHRRGFRFSTYAGWWIRHAIGRALADHGRLVRIPVHVHEARHRLVATEDALRIELGREPSREEVADATGMRVSKIDRIRRSGVVQEVHLDAPFGDDGDRSRADVFVDPTRAATAPDEALHRHALADAARRHLEALSAMEREVLRRRFALADQEREETFQEIGNDHGLSRERIRQIQAEALAKLRLRLVRDRLH